RERLVPVQQMLRVSAHDHAERIEKSLQIALFGEGSPEIRHDAVAHEHDPLLGKIDEHRVVRLTAPNRDQLELRSVDVQIRSIVDRDVRLVAPNVLEFETVAEKLLREDLRGVEFPLELLLIVPSPIESGTWAQAAEIRMTADMIPVRMSDEHGAERREVRRMGSQRLVSAFGKIRARARVNRDELMSTPRHDEVVFREFIAGERIDTAGNDLGDVSRRKRMTGCPLFGKWGGQSDRVVEIGITAAQQIVPSRGRVAVIPGQFAE